MHPPRGRATSEGKVQQLGVGETELGGRIPNGIGGRIKGIWEVVRGGGVAQLQEKPSLRS